MFRVFEFIAKTLAWLQIAIFPTTVGLILAVIIYSLKTNRTGFVLAVIAAVMGFLIGIIGATRIWKRKGTIEFMSKLIATSELDKTRQRKHKSTQQKTRR